MPQMGQAVKVIWGTNIVISEAISAFRSFLLSFCPAQRKRLEAADAGAVELPAITAADLEPLYPRLLRLIHDTRIYNLNLDGANLRAYPATQSLHQQLIHYPQEVISLMDMVVNELYGELFLANTNALGEDEALRGSDPIQVRVFNLGPSLNMRSLDPADIDKLICIKGLVIRVSNIIPDMRLAHFACTACGHAHTVEIVRGSIAEPQRCPRPECGAQWSQQLVHNRCTFADKQLIRLQETPDSIPAGQTPHTVTLCLYDALVDSARPGDRVEVTGIFRSSAVRLNPRQRRMKALFRTFVDVVHLRRLGSDGRLASEAAGGHEMTAADLLERSGEEILQRGETLEQDFALVEEEIQDLSQQPDLYATLSHALAPSIWGHENVKKALLLQLFGGVSKTLAGSARTRLRGDINVLLTGDPGVSKSQMLQCVHQLAPRGIYTSGKGSSAVGLTAYITRDSETGQLVLESGALVLSDGGICCIDEFDKMSDETRAILHEAMEQQTVSIAKAGIITTLNARSSILASANPVESKFNPKKSLVENINLPPTLLSRFDVIFVLLDRPSVEEDRRLGRHIVSLYSSPSLQTGAAVGPRPVPARLLRRYIAHARNLTPQLSEEACVALADGYVAMRRVNGAASAGKTISATTRQLESLVRLSEAHAKMRLSASVDLGDVEEAIRLVREALLQNAIDPLTGRIDMDLITTGRSAAARERQEELKRVVKLLLANRPQACDLAQLHRELNAQSSIAIPERLVREVVEMLVEEEYLQVMGGNVRRGTAIIQRV